MRRDFERTAEWLTQLPSTLPERPKAILSVTSHWKAPHFAVSAAERPGMIYDYSGFPPHTYQITYPAPGAPEVARRVQQLVPDIIVDSARGFDHGTFVPLMLMYPDADIPVVSMSIRADYDPIAHARLGEGLRPLRDEGVLIVGSGLTYHNLRRFGPAAGPVAAAFEEWLSGAISDPDKRTDRLRRWEQAPGAREAHPSEDHLVPLMVVAGAAGEDRGQRAFVDTVWGIPMASYRFG